MNHSQAINIWKGNNRVSRLWEDLLADRVSPDPPVMELLEVGFDSAGIEQPEEPTLLERAGFESLRLLKQALDILAAPPEDEFVTDENSELYPVNQSAGQLELENTAAPDYMPAGIVPGMTFVKVSSEPELQPVSAIDTRRMAYGLKVPLRPLHKRPIYQRLFFCLRNMMTR